MAQFMRNVREKGLSRANPPRPPHRLVYSCVAGMRLVAQR